MSAPAVTDPPLTAGDSVAPDRVVAADRPAAWKLYVALAKPRIATMTVVSALAGYALGGGVFLSTATAALAAGVWLVAAACGALNQWAEKDTDARMKRTATRPLPSGRLEPTFVFPFGLAAAVAGTAAMIGHGQLTAGVLSLATLVLYVAAYTPLKRRSVWCTAVGAVPGAMPPVIGYAAATGRLDATAGWLFAVFFLWQFPHFLAIGSLYARQYAGAGLKMLPDEAKRWGATGTIAVATAVLLIPSAAALVGHGGLGWIYGVLVAAAGVWYLAASVAFAADRNERSARKLLRVSLLYLPLWVLVSVVDHAF
ncbi:MAG: heme o synthase [Planctomycetota bacterium]